MDRDRHESDEKRMKLKDDTIKMQACLEDIGFND
jgi:hypothetical protein